MSYDNGAQSTAQLSSLMPNIRSGCKEAIHRFYFWKNFSPKLEKGKRRGYYIYGESRMVSVQTLLKIIGLVIILVLVWLVFYPTSPELRTKHKETLLKKRIEKVVEEIKKIDKEMQRPKEKEDH
jgi:hypothetical protein